MELLAVVGMHRSGTSLVAGMLRELGWDVGPEADLMPAKPDNPRGFVEHLPAVQINDRLLYRGGGSWAEPPALPAGWERAEALDDLRVEAREVVAGLSSTGSGRTLFKDPRLSLTLPFWQTVVDVPRVVLVLRPPRPVVRSLLRREDGMSAADAAALYTRYLLSALAIDADVHVVDPGDLMRSPEEELQSLSRALDHDPTSRELEQALASIDADLWGRSSHADEELGASPELEAAERLHSLVRGGDAEAWRSTLGGLVPATSLERLEARHRADLVDVEERLAESRARAERLRVERDDAREHHDIMRDQRDACLREIDRLRAERDRISGERDAARRRLVRRGPADR
jgi:hypothetical protein